MNDIGASGKSEKIFEHLRNSEQLWEIQVAMKKITTHAGQKE